MGVPACWGNRDDRIVTGIEAANQIIADAKREEFVAAIVVARALRCSRRILVNDWDARALPRTRRGRDVMLPAALVMETYFQHVKNPPSVSS